jgi:hypothetical protein
LDTKFDGDRQEHLQAYYSLFTSGGKVCRDEGLDITRVEYPMGYTLIGFNLTPDHSEGCHFNPVKHGNFRLSFKFSKPLEETTYLIVYAEFDNIIEIDEGRNVTYDYS